MSYFVLFTVALIVNIPCGYIREGHPKFSFKWFLWIHASIPLLIYLRIHFEISALVIPVSLTLAIIGQIIGSTLRKNKMSLEEKETLEQIPLFPVISSQKLNEDEAEVVLLNMGGPKTNQDVKEFQKWLFEDPLLIRFPLSFLLQKTFAWVLIFFRLNAVKKRYHEMGLKEGGSPIYPTTENQVIALQKELAARGCKIKVSYSFNYSSPYPKDCILNLKENNKKVIIPLSLYPHYSKATTGSNIFYLKKMAQNYYPSLKFLDPPSYHLANGYIQAFVDRIYEALNQNESLDHFYIMFSAHGLPQYFLMEGDPYPYLISQTVAKILSKLDREQNWCLCYQSAVGPFQWLKPSTDDMIKALALRKINKIIIIPISFVGDHIETTCEIDLEYRQMAMKLGITDYRMTKAIETHPDFIKSLADCVETTMQGHNKKQKTENHFINNYQNVN